MGIKASFLALKRGFKIFVTSIQIRTHPYRWVINDQPLKLAPFELIWLFSSAEFVFIIVYFSEFCVEKQLRVEKQLSPNCFSTLPIWPPFPACIARLSFPMTYFLFVRFTPLCRSFWLTPVHVVPLLPSSFF